jgi:dephospho-CoA kinase
MRVYGLTGGIGSGKSTVAEMFEQGGVDVFDADAIGHEILSGDSPEARQVRQRFPDCCGPDGIDRRRLGARVFADESQRRWLEDLLHPAIRRRLAERLEQLHDPRYGFCILEAAVLLESRTDFDLAGLLVVTADESVRVERLIERDGLAPAEIRQRMRAQLPDDEKVRRARYVIDNSGPLEQTRIQVDSVLQQLIEQHGGAA